MSEKRASWGSTFGFLMAAIGSAVGLGNIWGFPYKMGRSGGFTFLIVYLLLSLFVGFVIMMSELAIGRKTGSGVVGAYNAITKKFRFLGWLGILSPFLIMSFYSVLGGYCLEYMSLNLSDLAFGVTQKTGSELFGAMLTNQFGSVMFTVLFLGICLLIVKGGIQDGIEKFNTVGMPALFVMLVIIIIRSVTLPGAAEGLKFMFVPGYALEAGFIKEAPSLLSVIATAGGQMFFSLSLAMGIMVTYGSYLGKHENLVKNSAVIVVCDTLVALMAGLAVIPAAVATYGTSATLNGPKLLFITLQDVFSAMGTVGPLFGVIFYLLVFVAAISSAISLTEVMTTFFMDRAEKKGKTGNRNRISIIVCLVILAEAILVAVDGLGSNGVWVPGQQMFGIRMWNDCWLDFMDCWSEGVAMPMGAMLMALMVGWELKPKFVLDEIAIGGPKGGMIAKFYTIAIKFVAPAGMVLVFAGQIFDFFVDPAATDEVKARTQMIAYAISIAVLVLGFALAYFSGKNKKADE